MQPGTENNIPADTQAAGRVTYAADGDGTVLIALDRPAKLNALSDAMAAELRAQFYRFDLDPEANVAILCGEGRSFCAGADTTRHKRTTAERQMARLNDVRRDLLVQSINYKPVIAALHGHVYGFGLALALRADILVAADDARFQVAEIPRGLSGSGIWAALRFRGLTSFADEVVLTGRTFSAEEALAAGVINEVVAAGEHVAAARRWAARIAANPAGAVRDAVRTRRWYMQSAVRDAQLLSQPHPDLHETTEFKSRVRADAERARKD